MEQKMKAVKDFFTPKRVAVLKSYFRGVLVSALTLISSNALGLDPIVSAVLASIAGPAAKALDKQETEFGVGSEK
jgi:hypothetical protein